MRWENPGHTGNTLSVHFGNGADARGREDDLLVKKMDKDKPSKA